MTPATRHRIKAAALSIGLYLALLLLAGTVLSIAAAWSSWQHVDRALAAMAPYAAAIRLALYAGLYAVWPKFVARAAEVHRLTRAKREAAQRLRPYAVGAMGVIDLTAFSGWPWHGGV